MSSQTLEADVLTTEEAGCMKHLQSLLLNSSLNFSPYFDSTGRIESSLLNGNRVWLGDFSSCQSLPNSLYCLADLSVDMHPPLQDNFSSVALRWGLCAVASCNESVIQNHTPELVQGVLDVRWIEVLDATVNCARQIPFVAGFYATVSLLLMLVVFCLLGTTSDLWYEFTARMRWKLVYSITESGPHFVAPPEDPEWRDGASTTTLSSDDATPCLMDGGGAVGSLNRPPDQDLLLRAYRFRPDLSIQIGQCFSVNKNIVKLSARYSDDIVCLHFLRVLSLALVILGQTYLAAFSSGLISNPRDFRVFGERVSFQLIACSFYATDTFLLISGLLLAFCGLKRLRQSEGKCRLVSSVLHRYFRLMPSVCVLLLIWIYILPFCTAGPIWFETKDDTVSCEEFWWTNIIFIQNFYPTTAASSCVQWIWYLAVDWQLFCVASVMLFALYRGKGLLLLIFFVVCSLVVTATVIGVFQVKVSPAASLLHFNISSQQDFWKYVDVVLTKPYCRAVPYLVGLCLGWRLDGSRGSTVQLSRLYVFFGWILCIVLSCSAVYACYPLMLGYDYSPAASAICGSLGPLAWSLAVAWCIYACRHFCAGPLNFFFSWSGWVVLSRLTFGAFLFHGVFLYSYFHSLQQSFHLSDISMTSVYIMAVAFSFISSLLLSLLVELPVIRLMEMFSS